MDAQATLEGGRHRHLAHRAVDDLWPALDALGDRRSFYLLERFVKGDVYHVDSLVWERDVMFHAAHQYGAPPFSVAHQGGIFTTRTVPRPPRRGSR